MFYIHVKFPVEQEVEKRYLQRAHQLFVVDFISGNLTA
jgi:hypothetical protein